MISILFMNLKLKGAEGYSKYIAIRWENQGETWFPYYLLCGFCMACGHHASHLQSASRWTNDSHTVHP